MIINNEELIIKVKVGLISEGGMWNVECGMWNVECGMWNVECGMWNVECGMWNAECGIEDQNLKQRRCV